MQTQKFPFFCLCHSSEELSPYDIANLIDKFALITRLISNSNISVPIVRVEKIQESEGLKHSSHSLIDTIDKSMYFGFNQRYSFVRIDEKKYLEYSTIIEKIIKLNKNGAYIDIRKLYQAHYNFGEETVLLNLTILITMIESIYLLFKTTKHGLKFGKNENNRARIISVICYYEIKEYIVAFDLGYRLRNDFSHGVNLAKSKKKLSDSKFGGDDLDFNQRCDLIRGDLIELIIALTSKIDID